MTKFKEPFYIIVLPVIVLSIIAISYFRLLDNYELDMLDLRFQLRPQQPVTDKVVIVEISDDTLSELGEFPFSREAYSITFRALSDAGAKAVILDLLFTDPSEFDDGLAEAIKECGNVYVSFAFDFHGKTSMKKIPEAAKYAAENIPVFTAAAKGEGHINVDVDMDGKYRKVPLYIKYEDVIYPYVSFLVACDYLGIQQSSIKPVWGKYIDIGKGRKIPIDERSNLIVNFSGKWGKVYKHYSFYQIMHSYLHPEDPELNLKEIFKDKVCVIGLTALGTSDVHPTPFEKAYPAVGMHAEVFNSIISNRFVNRASRSMNLLILFILCCPIGVMAIRTRPSIALVFLGLTTLVFIITSILIFNFFGIWIDLLFPVMATISFYFILTFHKYFTEWRRRLVLENELGIAKKIQESFLPRHLPKTPGIEIAVSMFTARQVGGDLYDFVELGEDTLGVVIGDVSGKGIPASLFMAMVSAEFKFFATDKLAPDSVLINLNKRLVQESASNLFVTVFYMVFDLKNKNIVQYSNGGHLPAIYLGHGKDPELLDTAEGAPLGLIESNYVRKELNFEKGDIFVLYTDGVTEAMNSRSEMYGTEKLLKIIKSNKGLPPKAILDAIEKDIRRFEPKSKQHDDITILVIKIL